MKIAVKDESRGQRLSILVNGECNHGSTEFVDKEFVVPTFDGASGRWAADDSETIEVEQCTNCNAYREPSEDFWHG